MHIFAPSLGFSLLYDLFNTVPNILLYQTYFKGSWITKENKQKFKNNEANGFGNLLSTIHLQLTYFPNTFKI